MNNYVVYHLHSDISNAVTNIDSVTKFFEYIDKASELGMTAMAFSEHGSVMSWFSKKQKMEEKGIKYIHAEEFYITEKLQKNEDGSFIKLRDNWHCILIAKNFEGVKEINKLSSKSFNRTDGHYYYVPRIELEDLYNTSENVIITTACLGGVLNRASEKTQIEFIEFLKNNSKRCFIEIQHHDVEDQKIYNKKLLEISNKYGIPLIAGTDTHSLNEEHARGRVMLQKAKNINFGEEDGWDLTFKSYDDLCAAYKKQGALPEEVYLNAINNTNVMAEMIDTFEMDRHTKYPKIYDNPEETFKKKINESYKNHKYIKKFHKKEEIFERIKEEYDVYKKVGSIDFMLLEKYIREWEIKNDIHSGFGRGSVSGSLIAYILGITQMDSLKFDLNFFRFMNPSRVANAADIDTDYYEKDREKIKYFLLHDRMNLPNINTAEIITFNTIATKGAIKDICRAFRISIEEAQKISDSVDPDGNIPEDVRKKYKELCEYVDIVSGTIVSIGSHPSGVLVSDLPIQELVGMCSLATSDYQVSMLDMHDLDDQMYVKLDILGLDNIGIINETCRLIGEDPMTPDNVDLDDENVWKSIREDTTLIFQWESDSARDYLSRFMSDETIKIAKDHNKNFSWIKWMSFGNGLIRPGCASFRDDVANGGINQTGFKELDDFLSATFGRITMQEDIMRFCKLFCGYSDAESDTVRRAIAKKKGTENLLGELHDRFVKYSSEKYGQPKEKLEEIFPPIRQGILDASAYAFSWNHSDAYSCIGYISGYLRYYHPLEFLTSSFNIFSDKMEKLTEITKYANKVGIKILPIKFRHSRADYNMDKETNSIYKGMASIKYMNRQVSEDLYALRDKTYNSFIELLEDFTGDTRQREILIKLDFFEEFGKPKKLLEIAEIYDKFHGKSQIKKTEENYKIIPEELINEYSIKECDSIYKFDANGMTELLSNVCDYIPNNDITLKDRIKTQSEFLGYITETVEDADNCAYVIEIDAKYSPKVVLYDICSGKTFSAKIKKNAYKNNPIDVGDFIKYSITKEGKWTKVDNNWVQSEDPNNTEDWLGFYGKTEKYD